MSTVVHWSLFECAALGRRSTLHSSIMSWVQARQLAADHIIMHAAYTHLAVAATLLRHTFGTEASTRIALGNGKSLLIERREA